jgi:hypothetical protein
MKRLLGALVVAVLAGAPASADEKEAMAIVDKGIKALGGEEKLQKLDAVSWKSKGKLTFNENESEFTAQATFQGLDRYRGEFSTDQFQGVFVLSGSKGWGKFGENAMEMDEDSVKREKRQSIYLQLIPVKLLPLKGKEFKLDTAGEEKVDDKAAVGVKVTDPDGKEFTLYFDKESGLPVKLAAQVMGFGGQDEFKQETTYKEYKDFGGIKKATKVHSSRDGKPFVDSEVTEFKVLDKVPADTFSEPK